MAKELINEIKTSEYVDLTKLSPLERKALRNSRWKARTDMRYLCTEVLGMDTLFIEETHGNLIDSLQKFALPRSPKDLETHDRWDGKWIYTPLLEDMTLLPGKRRRLIIDFRGVGKGERASALVNMADGT